MNAFFPWIFRNRRLVLTVSMLFFLTGAAFWLNMVRQEDPRLPDFVGQVVVSYPGADALTVERLVLEPMEDALAEVNEVDVETATAYDEMAVVSIELRGDVKDFDEAWDDVRKALDKAGLEFPEGAGQPVLDDQQMDQDAVVLAVVGSGDPLVLLDGARKLKKNLQKNWLTKKVRLIADPGEQVTIALDDVAAERLGVSVEQIAAQLRERNRIISGGSLVLNDTTIRLRPLSEFLSLEEIDRTEIILAGGSSIPLSEIARVHMGPREPGAARMRLNGQMAVGVAVVPMEGINLVTFGDTVREQVLAFGEELSPLQVKIATFQPDRTKTRLEELNRSLIFSVLMVAGLLIMFMGLRLGAVVVAIVPLVVMTTVAIYAWNGGVLHQISIAALVLALGMLVDNAIVMAENVQWRLDQGQSPSEAALDAVRELAVPLAGATLTTLAAFVPMLISEGTTAWFTRAIPVIIMLALTISYGYALLVTPVLSQMILRPNRPGADGPVTSAGRRLAGLSINHPWLILTIAGCMLVLSLGGAPYVQKQFFPSADRNQVLVDIKLAEGSHLNGTDQTVRQVEKALLAREEVVRVTSFMGRGAPVFYYNVPRVPFSPHFGQLIVETRDMKDNAAVLAFTRNTLGPSLPGVELVPRKLEQGPRVDAPVEVRLTGSDLGKLNDGAALIGSALRSIAGTIDIRHDLGPGAPTLRFRIDDTVASRHGITRSDVARAIYGRTRGLPIGQLNIGEDPVPVVVRSSAGEQMAAADLDSVNITAADGGVIPLAQLAHIESVWQPAAIRHRNGERVVTVSSQLEAGHTFAMVLDELESRLPSLPIPKGVKVHFGGDAEGSGKANSALMRSLPIGLLLLLGILLAEFNSFRRVIIILATVPLAAAGIVPGLLIGGQPFGFMSLLGVMALVGIVVNNAIVLLEVVESRRRQGATVPEALHDAVVRRIRPILLTTATTVAGLLPLALASSTLWPPLASAMISGLIASTLLTLVVVPALYRILMMPFRLKMPRVTAIRRVRPPV